MANLIWQKEVLKEGKTKYIIINIKKSFDLKKFQGFLIPQELEEHKFNIKFSKSIIFNFNGKILFNVNIISNTAKLKQYSSSVLIQEIPSELAIPKYSFKNPKMYIH